MSFLVKGNRSENTKKPNSNKTGKPALDWISPSLNLGICNSTISGTRYVHDNKPRSLQATAEVQEKALKLVKRTRFLLEPQTG